MKEARVASSPACNFHNNRRAKNGFAQAHRVAVPYVIHPPLHALLHRLVRGMPGPVAVDERAEPPPVVHSLAPLEPAPVRIDDEAQEGKSLTNRARVGAVVNGQTKVDKAFLDGRLPRPQRRLVVGEKQVIIDVAEIRPAP